MAFDAREVLEDAGIRDDGARPVMNAVREITEALEKLSSLVAALEGRVEPIRSRNRVDDEENQPAKAVQRIEERSELSPLAHELIGHAHQIGRIGRRISRVIEELEV